MVNEDDLYTKYYAVVAAISADQGMDAIMVFESAVTKDSFIEFLEYLRELNGRKKLVIFLDNLRVHKTAEVTEWVENSNMELVFNVPYKYQY